MRVSYHYKPRGQWLWDNGSISAGKGTSPQALEWRWVRLLPFSPTHDNWLVNLTPCSYSCQDSPLLFISIWFHSFMCNKSDADTNWPKVRSICNRCQYHIITRFHYVLVYPLSRILILHLPLPLFYKLLHPNSCIVSKGAGCMGWSVQVV